MGTLKRGEMCSLREPPCSVYSVPPHLLQPQRYKITYSLMTPRFACTSHTSLINSRLVPPAGSPLRNALRWPHTSSLLHVAWIRCMDHTSPPSPQHTLRPAPSWACLPHLANLTFTFRYLGLGKDPVPCPLAVLPKLLLKPSFWVWSEEQASPSIFALGIPHPNISLKISLHKFPHSNPFVPAIQVRALTVV